MVPAQRRPCQVVRDAWHFDLGLGVDFDIRAATVHVDQPSTPSHSALNRFARHHLIQPWVHRLDAISKALSSNPPDPSDRTPSSCQGTHLLRSCGAALARNALSIAPACVHSCTSAPFCLGLLFERGKLGVGGGDGVLKAFQRAPETGRRRNRRLALISRKRIVVILSRWLGEASFSSASSSMSALVNLLDFFQGREVLECRLHDIGIPPWSFRCPGPLPTKEISQA